MPTYYEILEIPINATYNDIRNAYKKKSLESHPDKHSLNDEKLWTERFKEIAHAYNTLINEKLRKKYDQQISKSFYKKDQPATNTQFSVNIFTNQTTNKLNNLISEIHNLLNNIQNFKIKENNLEYLKQLWKDINKKMATFNSLFKRLDWVLINGSPESQKESEFLKTLIHDTKLRDKVADAYSFLFLQEIKFNLIKDTEFLEMIINNHHLLATQKWRFNDISLNFFKLMKNYNIVKQDIKDFYSFEFTNSIKDIDNFSKIKRDLIEKINKILLELTIKEELLKKEQLRQEVKYENIDDITDIKQSKQLEPHPLRSDNQMKDYWKQQELKYKIKEKEITNKISKLKANNIIIKKETEILEKNKINPLLNFIFSLFSFNYYNKDNKINENINIKNNEIKNNLLIISELESELTEIAEELLPPIDMDEYLSNLEKNEINATDFQNQASTTDSQSSSSKSQNI